MRKSWKNALIGATAGLIALASAPLSYSIEMVLLSKEQVALLSPQAREVYEQGADAYDKINNERALEKFTEAMKLEPKHTKLRFLVGDFAMHMGEVKSGDESMRYFGIADEAFKPLVDRETLKPEDRRRADAAYKTLKQNMDNIASRDAKRQAVSKQLISAIVADREKFAKEGLKPLGMEGGTASRSAADAEGARGAGARGVGGVGGRGGARAGGRGGAEQDRLIGQNASSSYYRGSNMRGN